MAIARRVSARMAIALMRVAPKAPKTFAVLTRVPIPVRISAPIVVPMETVRTRIGRQRRTAAKVPMPIAAVRFKATVKSQGFGAR